MRMLKVMAVAVMVAGCSSGEGETTETAGTAAPQPMQLQPGDVATIEPISLAGGVMLNGTLNPARIVEVRAQVPGMVARLAVDRGDAVREGQLLATIEADGIRSMAAGAAAQVSAAQAAVAVAEQRLESSKKLFERGAISEIDMKTAQAAYQAAQGQLAAAQAQAAGANESARRANVTAPIAGEVSQRHVSEGEAVNPGQAIVTVVNSTSLELAGQIPVVQAANVQPGQRVEFTLDAYPGQKFEGTVARVDPTADPATRQVGVYLRLPNPGRRIVGGLFATGRVLTGATTSVLAVPEAAIRREGESAFVFVVENDMLKRRVVQLGMSDPTTGQVEVVEGLTAGDRVLVAPGMVQDNTPVRFGAAVSADAGKGTE